MLHNSENSHFFQGLRLKKKVQIIGLIVGMLISSSAMAVNSVEMRQACYNSLVDNIEETRVFEEAEKEFKSMSYKQLEAKTSRYYKNMSSFGIDVDTPIFEQRIYSFGAQTGYVHPPFSPFPTYTKTDKWKKPAKQNIYSEEYVIDENGRRNFLGCGFFRIEANDLKMVTGENYSYDGELISVLKDDFKNGNKVWYNENISYDHDNKPFVTWQRLFVYPKVTVNSYFDRYSVAEVFPSKASDTLDIFIPKRPKVEDLSAEDLASIKKSLGKENPTNEEIEGAMGDGAPRIYMIDQNGNITKSIAPEALKPSVKQGNDQTFALTSFYQAIEDKFPVFAKHLALRGVVKFDTLKKVLASKNAPELAHIWGTVLDSRAITTYALEKKQGKISKKDEVDFYETYLPKLAKMEQEITESLAKVKVPRKIRRTEKSVNVVNDLTIPEKGGSVIESTRNTMLYLWGGLGVLFLIIVIYLLGRKK